MALLRALLGFRAFDHELEETAGHVVTNLYSSCALPDHEWLDPAQRAFPVFAPPHQSRHAPGKVSGRQPWRRERVRRRRR